MGFSVLFLILVRRDWFQIVRDLTPVALDIPAMEYVLGDLERSRKYLPCHRHHSSRGLLKVSLVLNVSKSNFEIGKDVPRSVNHG